MPKLSKRLEEIRSWVIVDLVGKSFTNEDIGKIFSLSSSTIYRIINEREKHVQEKSESTSR